MVVDPGGGWDRIAGLGSDTVSSFFPNGKGTYAGYTANQAIGFAKQAQVFCNEAVNQHIADASSRSASYNQTLESISAALPPAQ